MKKILALTLIISLFALSACIPRTLTYDRSHCIYIEPFIIPAELTKHIGLDKEDRQTLLDPDMYAYFKKVLTEELAKQGIQTCDSKDETPYSLVMSQIRDTYNGAPAPLPLPAYTMGDLIIQIGATLAGYYGRAGYDFGAEVYNGADYELRYSVGLQQRIPGERPINKTLDSGKMYHYKETTPEKIEILHGVFAAIAAEVAKEITEFEPQ